MSDRKNQIVSDGVFATSSNFWNISTKKARGAASKTISSKPFWKTLPNLVIISPSSTVVIQSGEMHIVYFWNMKHLWLGTYLNHGECALRSGSFNLALFAVCRLPLPSTDWLRGSGSLTICCSLLIGQEAKATVLNMSQFLLPGWSAASIGQLGSLSQSAVGWQGHAVKRTRLKEPYLKSQFLPPSWSAAGQPGPLGQSVAGWQGHAVKRARLKEPLRNTLLLRLK